MSKRLISAIQPTGNLHLGNYLGSLKYWSEYQNKHECIFFIADLHAITVAYNPTELKNSIIHTLATYIACGVDPQKSIIFQQSDIVAHSELAWIFSSIATIGWLKRMTQFKDKTGSNTSSGDKAKLGLLSYPVLMAADILLYDAEFVPVGEDQTQHLELARDIASSFNQKYNTNIFTLPKALINPNCMRIKSLKDGTRKMSKSDPSDLSRINLSDSIDNIVKKIRKAKTDSIPQIGKDIENRPEIKNLFEIWAGLIYDYNDYNQSDNFQSSIKKSPINELKRDKVIIDNKQKVTAFDVKLTKLVQEHYDKDASFLKNTLTEIIIDKIGKISQISKELLEKDQDDHFLKKILQEGQKKAFTIANKKLNQIKEIIGF